MSQPHLHLPRHGLLLPRRSRRVFLADLGKGALAALTLPVFAACADDDDPSEDTPTSTPMSTSTVPPAPTEGAAATTEGSPAATEGTPAGTSAGSWGRVVLGGMSAYVLLRDGEAAVVDTGNPGSAGDIEAALAGLGVGWESVGHVVLTHAHPDHQGSLPEVLELAPDAMAYCGAGDLGAIVSPRPPTTVVMGDQVFGLDVIETPGHTPGHICVLDRAASVLVAGDALTGAEGGGVAGPNERFTPDMDTAWASVGVLGSYDYETVFFGHGDPVTGGASEAVAALFAEQA